jgi:hypothetical protein
MARFLCGGKTFTWVTTKIHKLLRRALVKMAFFAPAMPAILTKTDIYMFLIAIRTL